MFGQVELKVKSAELKTARSEPSGLSIDLENLQRQIRENKVTRIALGQVKNITGFGNQNLSHPV